jgi:type II protein arginine methyltransferase
MITDISRQVLMMEVAYAAFCGIRKIIITGPELYGIKHVGSEGIAQYAQAVQEALLYVASVHLAIHTPMCYQKEALKQTVGHLAALSRERYTETNAEVDVDTELYGSWDSWNVIRSVCEYSPRLSIGNKSAILLLINQVTNLCLALLIPQELPLESLQSRWFAEPLGFLLFTAATFLPNSKGQLQLSKGQQSLIFRYMRQQQPPWLLLYDIEPSLDHKESEPTESSSTATTEAGKNALEKTLTNLQRLGMHLRYFRLLQRHQPAKTAMEKFGSRYEDYLQPPMQPLSDNLDSRLSEGIETDPTKYEWYERAITHALTDWDEKQKPTSGPDKRVVIAVVGPGRGPLVTRALRASDATKVPVEMWAVEKNPLTYVVLEQHNKHDWGGVVNIVHSDIRAWKGPSRSASDAKDVAFGKVDILVSELLGSFGDNELSPESLDSIQHVLATPHGISIPSSYSAHLTPILAPRVHGQISRTALTNPVAYDTTYCVYLYAIDYLATSVPDRPYIQQAWEFVHPLPASTLFTPEARVNKHNVRFSKLKFTCKNRGVVSGIAGYLEVVLYDGGKGKLVELSMRPDTIDKKSKDILRWLPMYFPLKVS